MGLRSIVVLFLAVITCRADAENWNQFRGSNGDGHSVATGLPVEWNATKSVRWKTPDLGEGWSSPVVWEEDILLTTARPVAGKEDLVRDLSVICLDANSGVKKWEVVVFEQTESLAQSIHKKNSHASPTPIVDGKHIWVHFGTQGTACLTRAGKTVWKRNDIRYEMQHGNGGSPVIVDDVLFFSCDGRDRAFVIALDKMTGKTLWSRPRPRVENAKLFSFNTPTVIELDGQKQILSQGSDVLTAFSPQDGRELWWFRYDGYSVIPKPVYAHGLVYLCTSYNQSKLHVIDPRGTGDITETNEAWTAPKNIPHTPSVLIVGEELYLVSDRGVATCFDAKSGDIHWQERLGGNYSASPIFADGKIYFLSEEGVATVLAPGKTFQVLAKNELGERTLASFAVVGSDLLIRTDQHLYRVSAH